MASPIPQPSFSRGEISPAAFGRVDLAAYANGLATCRNFILRVLGSLSNRPGTVLVCENKFTDKTARLISFQFNVTQGYCLQFEDGWLRVIKDGGQVLAVRTITATTDATPVVVTSVAHGFVDGALVTIAGTGIAALDGIEWTVANKTDDTFELSASTAPGSTASSGTATGIFEIESPFTLAELDALKFDSLADVMTLTHNSVQTTDLSRSAHDRWAFTDTEFKLGPFQEINVERTQGVSASATTGAVTIRSSHPIFNADQVGMLFYMEQKNAGKPWEPAKSIASPGAIRVSDGRYYRSQDSGTTGTRRPTNEVVGDTEQDGTVTWEYVHSGFGVAQIDTVIDAYTVTATIINELPDEVTSAAAKTITGAADNGSGLIRISSAAHGYSNNDVILVYGVTGTTEANGLWVIEGVAAGTFDLKKSAFVNTYSAGGEARSTGTYKWAFGAFGGDQGWPGIVVYFQQRRGLAATLEAPTTIWLSGSNAFDAFGRSTPVKDDDAITMQLAGGEVNEIRHMLGLGKLVVFTAGGKWVIPDDDNSPILTPAQRSARPQGSLGASNVRPALIEDSILYALDKGGSVFDLAYQFASNSFSGNDLSVLSEHLLEGHTIVDAAYQHVPFRCWWIVRDDGVLIGLTYLKEHQVWGWHRHDTRHGAFERVCVVSEPPEDAVYLQVRRTIMGVDHRYIERLSRRYFTDIKDAIFMDSALTYDGRNTQPIGMTLTSSGSTWAADSGETFTLTASETSGGGYGYVDYFNVGHVGDEIHLTDIEGRTLRLLIVAYTSPTEVTVTLNRDVPDDLQNHRTSAWGHAKQTFTGMDHIEGETIAILADGHVHRKLGVNGGAFTLDYFAVVVHAGLPIEADVETLDINNIGQQPIRGNEKIVASVDVLVDQSRGIWAGPDFDNLTEHKEREDEDYDAPVDLFTGQAKIRIASTWSKGGRIVIRQSDPLPLNVLSIVPNIEIGGS